MATVDHPVDHGRINVASDSSVEPVEVVEQVASVVEAVEEEQTTTWWNYY